METFGQMTCSVPQGGFVPMTKKGYLNEKSLGNVLLSPEATPEIPEALTTGVKNKGN